PGLMTLSASIVCTNLMTSPPSAQPWQYHRPRDGVTFNEGVFSSWNGQRPFTEPPPALLSCRYSPITSSTGERSRTAAMSSSRIRPATIHLRARFASPVAASLVPPTVNSPPLGVWLPWAGEPACAVGRGLHAGERRRAGHAPVRGRVPGDVRPRA